MSSRNFLDAHLNVNWLRPESALWDAIASSTIAQFPILSPSLDLGSGNGIFSFITAGGAFSLDYDWYRNVNPDGFWDNRDIYDTLTTPPTQSAIIRPPDHRIDCALDAKQHLLCQAETLKFYRHVVLANANHRLPFRDSSFETVFSNILYWLDSAEASMKEIKRVLRSGGRSLLCLPDHKFKDYCISYHWRELNSEALRLLNRGRSESSRWAVSYSELMDLAKRIGFKVVAHSYYLSPLTLKLWDIGLRPLSPVLFRMIKKLTEADRLSIKSEWIHILRPFLIELYELDGKSNEQGGYHFVCLEKQ
jgi:SAM-dependent methyltransferase